MLFLNFYPLFEKKLNFEFFQKINFWLKKSENLETYPKYEFRQFKNTKFASYASGSSVKNIEFLLRVIHGKITLVFFFEVSHWIWTTNFLYMILDTFRNTLVMELFGNTKLQVFS